MTNYTLRDRFFELEKEATKLKISTRKNILSSYGSLENFHKTLTVEIINCPNQLGFKDLFTFYSSFFTLPEETETYDGFETTLALNTHEGFLKKFGAYEEAWMYVRNPENDDIIAGLNFSIYKLPETESRFYSYSGTAHIIYIFVKAEYRSLKLAGYLFQALDNYAKTFFGSSQEILYICEQNAPEKMSFDDYFSDNINALIDQCDRLIWWDKLGYKRLQFDYVQPPLNIGQEACINLTLNARAPGKQFLPAALISFHLERFFFLAVFKGREERKDYFYETQMEWLKKNNEIMLTGDVELYKILKMKFY
ncbi:MAG: hypothetical protein PHT69_10585 [Bacteroidales bacterium]|nr:hypothetical protein [Bacteroidales bacterium]